jgi:drug/metabolite transporter (DMT)-like permease
MFFASNFQQVGLVYTSASKSGFITALYIVLVPVAGVFAKSKKKLGWNIWVAVAIAAVGMYLLSVTADFTLAPADLLLFACAIFWTAHILTVDKFAASSDAIALSFIQFTVTGVLSLIVSIFADPPIIGYSPAVADVLSAVPTMLYTGIMSSGVAFTLQIAAQKHMKPAVAAIVMSLECVFGLLGGMLILGERMTTRESIGCALIFIAVLTAQIRKGGNETNNSNM